MSSASGATDATPAASAAVELRAADLLPNGTVYCPNPKMPLWCHHPRVFLHVAASGEGRCPYCGTVYRLAAGEPAPHGH
jgi:uncharacterized Zn-finger protein